MIRYNSAGGGQWKVEMKRRREVNLISGLIPTASRKPEWFQKCIQYVSEEDESRPSLGRNPGQHKLIKPFYSREGESSVFL